MKVFFGFNEGLQDSTTLLLVKSSNCQWRTSDVRVKGVLLVLHMLYSCVLDYDKDPFDDKDNTRHVCNCKQVI